MAVRNRLGGNSSTSEGARGLPRASAPTPIWKQPVVKRPLNQEFPDLGSVREFRNKVCLFNHDRTRIFNVVSSKYNLVEHSLLYDKVRAALGWIIPGDIECKVLTLNHGARARFVFALPETYNQEVTEGDIIKPMLFAQNSYDGAWKLGIGLQALRVVCHNGLTVPFNRVGFSGKHFSFLGESHVLADRIKNLVRDFSTIMEVWRAMDELTITRGTVLELLDGRVPQKYLAVILDNPFPATMWSAYNYATAVTSHQIPSDNRRIELSSVVSEAFFGLYYSQPWRLHES